MKYVLGGPIDREIENRKTIRDQPFSEFNVFVSRNDAQLVTTDLVRGGAPTSLRRHVALAYNLSRRSADYDVLVASGEDIGFPLALLGLTRRRPKPVWIILHGSYLQGRKFKAIASMLRRSTHVHFLCLSESLRRQMIDVHGFLTNHCHNAGYGVDTDFFHPTGAPAAPLIVAAGSANRDYRTLIQAVEGQGVSLRVAADSLWRPKATELGPLVLPSGVDVRSAGNYLGLRDLYAQASFVAVPLHPARYASGYAVIAEAMAMGKAVITTRTEAPSDLVVEGETGFYTEPGDVFGLRDKIRLLLDDPARARAMGEAGAARMRSAFSLDAYCQTMEQFIEAGSR